MKKSFLCIGILLLIVVLLTGCNEGITLRFREESYTMYVGESMEADLKVFPKQSEVTLYSANTACVETDGRTLYAKSTGVARITAVSGTKTAETTIYVLSGKGTDIEQPILTDPANITFLLQNYAEIGKETDTLKTLITSEGVDITESFPVILGYTISWYTDAACTNPVGKTVLAGEGNATYYGIAKALPNPYILDAQNRICGITFSNLPHAYLFFPEEQNGVTIKGIADEAFMGDTTVITVSVPSCYTYIGKFAFAGCTALTTFSAEEGLSEIGAYCFAPSYQSDDEEITLNEDACAALTKATLPSSVKTIGVCAFYKCSALVLNGIPKSLEKVEKLAFSETQIDNIDFSNVTYIGEYAFYDCPELTTVTHTEKVSDCGGFAFGKTPLFDNQAKSGDMVYADTILIGCYEYFGYFKGKGKIYLKTNATLLADYALSTKYLTDVTVYFPRGSAVKLGERVFYVKENDASGKPVYYDSLYLAVYSEDYTAYTEACLPAYKKHFCEKTDVVVNDSEAVNFGKHTLLKFSETSYVYDGFTPNKVQEKYVLPTEIDLSKLTYGKYITKVATCAFMLNEYASCEGKLKIIRLGRVSNLAYNAISGCPDLELIDITATKDLTLDSALSVQFADFPDCVLLTKYSAYTELLAAWTDRKTARSYLRYLCEVTCVYDDHSKTEKVYAPGAPDALLDETYTWYTDAERTRKAETISGESITLYAQK